MKFVGVYEDREWSIPSKVGGLDCQGINGRRNSNYKHFLHKRVQISISFFSTSFIQVNTQSQCDMCSSVGDSCSLTLFLRSRTREAIIFCMGKIGSTAPRGNFLMPVFITPFEDYCFFTYHSGTTRSIVYKLS